MSLAGFVIFNSVLLVAAACDVRTFRIPNLLPMLLALAAIPFNPPTIGAEAWGRLACVAIVAAVCLTLYLRNAFGGGDVKLLVAAALWLPLADLPVFATVLGVAGAVQGLGTLLVIRLAPGTQPQLARNNYHQMPYGVSIAAAGLFWSLMTTFA